MKLPTVLDPIQLSVNLGSNLTFYKEITPLELENLLEWRNGGDVALRWSFRGKGLADVNGRTILLELSDDPTSSIVQINLSQNKWDSLVRRCKLDDRFISEFPLSVPDSLKQKTSPFLNEILSDLTSMVVNLNSAKDRIRKANNTSDYKAVMGEVKSSLDSIKNLQVSPSNAKQFFVDSGTFIDRDRGGGEKAALEVIARIQSNMEHIYQISSKAAHTELKKGGLKFEMNPDKEDALFVFESSLALLRYFIEKLKKLK